MKHITDDSSSPALLDAPGGASRWDETSLVDNLVAGDEAAFAALVEDHHAPLLRWARFHLSDAAAAEDVVQETWMAVLRGIDTFERRSSLRTWLFRILMNRIRSRQRRETRQVPFSSVQRLARQRQRSFPEVILQADVLQWPGYRRRSPSNFADNPEDLLISSETREMIRAAVAGLPATQRQVVTLRDLDGWSSGEVCRRLRISEVNQRVLLHRARVRLRAALVDRLG